MICWVQSDQYIVGRFDDDFQVKPLCDAGKSVPCIDGGLPKMESGNVSEPPKMKDELNSDAEFQDDECKASSNCCNYDDRNVAELKPEKKLMLPYDEKTDDPLCFGKKSQPPDVAFDEPRKLKFLSVKLVRKYDGKSGRLVKLSRIKAVMMEHLIIKKKPFRKKRMDVMIGKRRCSKKLLHGKEARCCMEKFSINDYKYLFCPHKLCLKKPMIDDISNGQKVVLDDDLANGRIVMRLCLEDGKSNTFKLGYADGIVRIYTDEEYTKVDILLPEVRPMIGDDTTLPEGWKLDNTVQGGWKKSLFQLVFDDPNYSFWVQGEDCKKPEFVDVENSDDIRYDDNLPDGWKLTESLDDHLILLLTFLVLQVSMMIQLCEEIKKLLHLMI